MLFSSACFPVLLWSLSDLALISKLQADWLVLNIRAGSCSVVRGWVRAEGGHGESGEGFSYWEIWLGFKRGVTGGVAKFQVLA